jgi:hypothetical protein
MESGFPSRCSYVNEVVGVSVWSGDGRRGLQQVPDAAGEVAFEAADGVFGALTSSQTTERELRSSSPMMPGALLG